MEAAKPVKQTPWDAIYKGVTPYVGLNREYLASLGNPLLRKLDCSGFLAPGDPPRILRLFSKHRASSGEIGSKYVLLDLGCGVGGLGEWIAAEIVARLIGIDSSCEAVCSARKRGAENPGVRQQRYLVADFERTGLPKRSVNGVFSLDALYLSRRVKSSLKEVNRILVKGGLLYFTTYLSGAEHRTGVVENMRIRWGELLRTAGFSLIYLRNATRTWRRMMRAKHASRLRNTRTLRALYGAAIEPELIVSERMLGKDRARSFIGQTWRFEIVATRSS